MSNNALFTIEQVDNKLIITVEVVKLESPVNTDWPRIDEVDLSKYKPFPKNYRVPNLKEIRAIKIYEEEDYIKLGAIGTIVGDGGLMPIFKCDNKSDLSDRLKEYENVNETIHYLAPLDPSDHPDYKAEEPEQRPMNADEIVTWLKGQVDLALRQPHLVAEINISDKINALVQYELNKAKQ